MYTSFTQWYNVPIFSLDCRITQQQIHILSPVFLWEWHWGYRENWEEMRLQNISPLSWALFHLLTFLADSKSRVSQSIHGITCSRISWKCFLKTCMWIPSWPSDSGDRGQGKHIKKYRNGKRFCESRLQISQRPETIFFKYIVVSQGLT